MEIKLICYHSRRQGGTQGATGDGPCHSSTLLATKGHYDAPFNDDDRVLS